MSACIYVLQDITGRIKLGISKHPIRRSRNFGPGVELVATTDMFDEAPVVEKLAHRVLALHGKHLRGEWFLATVDDALKAIEIARRQAARIELPLGGQLKGGTSDTRHEMKALARRRSVEKMIRVRFNDPADGEIWQALVKINRDVAWLAAACNVSVETAERWAKGDHRDIPRAAVVLLRLLAERPEMVLLLEHKPGDE